MFRVTWFLFGAAAGSFLGGLLGFLLTPAAFWAGLGLGGAAFPLAIALVGFTDPGARTVSIRFSQLLPAITVLRGWPARVVHGLVNLGFLLLGGFMAVSLLSWVVVAAARIPGEVQAVARAGSLDAPDGLIVLASTLLLGVAGMISGSVAAAVGPWMAHRSAGA